MAYIGINIGSITCNFVKLENGKLISETINHKGQPLNVVDNYAGKLNQSNNYYGISGHLGHISEQIAIERALSEIREEFDAIVSLGGEAFVVYLLQNNHITNVLSHNRCAAGSGEFLIQQINRLNLNVEEAIKLAMNGKSIRLASRCSVHCKSDVTHKLNRQEATVEDILWSIHESMAKKIVSLLEKSQAQLTNILIIGGLANNQAMIKALKDTLTSIKIQIIPDSPYFEAYGTALLTKDNPSYTTPQTLVKPMFVNLPMITESKSHVKFIRTNKLKSTSTVSTNDLILGIDGGSTTTKVVLLDSRNFQIISSHYTRTNGDPISATRECIKHIIDQVGNKSIILIGTTGSAREIIGAYLGTSAIYNEISAHAAGAAYYDQDVDTIFEIGGQDSKYIYLQNGVPIDYAMNAACSAGTGSFLEESARGDLSVSMDEISQIAISSSAPIRFKADCAAFINSDIRSALQEGYSKDNIIGGLVNSIVNNYLTKVKGSKRIGKKIFFQGGVAKNDAVAYAFAQATKKEIIVPPDPELMGAFGVCLISKERMESGVITFTSKLLMDLTSEEMKSIGKFTCRVCENFCNIEKYEVGGRKFPFGGLCSKYENQWKVNYKNDEVKDIVTERNEIIFSIIEDSLNAPKSRIGIPRALTSHLLLPLYYTFFKELGFNVVVSNIHPDGELKANAPFCFPTQIAHGAVYDLIQRNIHQIFLPQVQRMPFGNEKYKSYLCPITQANPYIMNKAFEGVSFLNPVLDFVNGYEASDSMIKMAVNDLSCSKNDAEAAYSIAINVQMETERNLRSLGQKSLKSFLKADKPAIILAGRSYNAFPNESSQSVGRKLASKGILTIPHDCLGPQENSSMAWYYSNLIMDAVNLVKKHDKLFLVYITNFGCNIDGFTNELLRKEMGSKPYLILEIDSHSADAGTQTRLEAFIEIIENYLKLSTIKKEEDFYPCRIETDRKSTYVISSKGKRIEITDPRVKIYFPVFSQYHNEAISLGFRWLGLNAPNPKPIDHMHLEKGLQHTSGKECLPLPLTLGQLLSTYEEKEEGDIIGFYSITGGAPCVITHYLDYYENFIQENKLEDVFMFIPDFENNFFGMGKSKLFQFLPLTICLADVMLEIHNTLAVVGKEGSTNLLRSIWLEFIKQANFKTIFDKTLPDIVDRIQEIEIVKDPKNCPRIAVSGDFFVRFDPFFFKGLEELYQENGIILKPVDLNELLLYRFYDTLAEKASEWGVKPVSKRAMISACARGFTRNGLAYLGSWISVKVFQRLELKIRNAFQDTGLLIASPNNVASLFNAAIEHIDPTIFGESVISIGKGVAVQNENYEGIIVLGPFSCLPFRIAESILKPLCIKNDFPILTYETDGYSVPPTFLRLVNVHIQQVLRKYKEKLVNAPVSKLSSTDI